MKRMMIRGVLSVCALCVPAMAEGDGEPLIPDAETLLEREQREDLSSTVRMLENVVESARSTRLNAVDRNMTYNERRREEIHAEVEAMEKGLVRLDDAVGLQFEKIREQFGGEIPAEYLDWVRQMQRQHQVARARLEQDIADRQAELLVVEQRLSDGAVEREVARIEQELAVPFEPADFLDPTSVVEPETADDELDYLQNLSNRRLRARVLDLTDPRPVSVMPGVLSHLVVTSCR